MKRNSRKSSGGKGSASLLFALALILPLLLMAAPPAWWSQREVLNGQTANDYAAANQGQLKHVAQKAMNEMDQRIPGGAGTAVHALVNGWLTPTANTHDYAALNLGQLKNAAKPFHDRLKEIGYTDSYPWDNSPTPANDYAMANLGQVKNVFSFDLTSTDAAHDTDHDGLPDWWEHYFNIAAGTDPNALAPRGDGLTYLQALEQGLNPVDFYNGQTPTLSKISGDNQTGPPNGFVRAPLMVSVVAGNGQPCVNAPVTFAVTNGGGTVQKSSSASASASITVRTDSSGQAKAFFKLPNATSHTSTITGTAGSGIHSSQVSFSESSDNGSGTYDSPFDASDVVAHFSADGSVDVSWTNHADPDDPDPTAIQYLNRDGQWVTLTSVPAGVSSVHVPAP